MFKFAPNSSSRHALASTHSLVQVLRIIRGVCRGASRPSVLALAAVIIATFAAAAGASPSAVPGSASPAEFAGSDSRNSAWSARAGDPWAWSAAARAWTRSSGVLPAGLVRRGPRATITRGEFLDALLRVESLRGVPRRGLLQSPRPAPALADAVAGSPQARAVAHGWVIARAGRFDATAPITADEAALAIAGALGLRPTVVAFAARLRTELPGVRTRWIYAAAHSVTRTLGLRYNVLDPFDELELGPSEPVNVAHGAYMLQIAALRVDRWKLDEAIRMATTFDLPALGANQTVVLGAAVRQLGQPYVWAGETEGAQIEGHGGFDCSGFAIRVLNGAGLPLTALAPMAERTTYTQSAIPAARRIARDALQPGDAIFFGDNGAASSPTQNFHAGVYMGNGWFIHSSGSNGGVAINALDGWWGDRFAWGRRLLLTP